MRIVIITQNEPFYLARNLDFLIKNLPRNVSIIGVCLTSASPYGKKESFIKNNIYIYINT